MNGSDFVPYFSCHTDTTIIKKSIVMAKNAHDLKFTMSYGELVNRSYELEAAAARDESILIKRGIPKSKLDSLPALRDAFTQTPSDETMQGLVSVETDRRDKVIEQIVVGIREIQGIAKFTFGAESGEYRTFAPYNLTQLTPADLLRLVDVTIARGTDHFVKMAVNGLTTDMLTDLGNLKDKAEPLIKSTDLAQGNRKQTTVVRHDKANALFDLLTDICEAGTVYFQDRDPVKAEDYVMDDIPDNVQERKGEVEKNAIVYRELLGVDANTRFQLKVSNGDELVFYFSKTKDGLTGGKSLTVKFNPNVFTEARAADLGYSKPDGNIFFCIKNPNDDEAAVYRVRAIG